LTNFTDSIAYDIVINPLEMNTFTSNNMPVAVLFKDDKFSGCMMGREGREIEFNDTKAADFFKNCTEFIIKIHYTDLSGIRRVTTFDGNLKSTHKYEFVYETEEET
jgi:hypothetical protein